MIGKLQSESCDFLAMTSGMPERLKGVFPCFANSAAKSKEICTNLKRNSFLVIKLFAEMAYAHEVS